MGRSLVHGRRTATADGVTPGTGTEMRPERPFYIRERSGRRWGRPDGAMDSGGLVLGTYIHGLLHNSGLRLAILRSLAQRKGVVLPQGGDEYDRESRQGEYDRLADLVPGQPGYGPGVPRDRPRWTPRGNQAQGTLRVGCRRAWQVERCAGGARPHVAWPYTGPELSSVRAEKAWSRSVWGPDPPSVKQMRVWPGSRNTSTGSPSR